MKKILANIYEKLAGDKKKSELESVVHDISSELVNYVNKIKDSSMNLISSSKKISRETKNVEEMIGTSLEESETTEAIIVDLYKSSNKIKDLLEAISDIGIQTKVLALNANIEAEKAGEAGRGFAVVASEVSDLSKLSKKSLEMIEENLSSIQSQLGMALGSITKTTKSIRTVDKISHTISLSLTKQNQSNAEIENYLESINKVVTEAEVF